MGTRRKTRKIDLSITRVDNAEFHGFKKMIGCRVHYLGQTEAESMVKLLQIIAETRYGVRLVKACDAPAAEEGSVMLHTAIEDFGQHIRASALHDTWKTSYVARMDQVKAALGMNRPLQIIGYDELVRLVNHYVALPASTRTRKRISPVTAKGLIKVAASFFRWAEDSGRWSGPRNWTRCFSIRGRLKIGTTYGQIKMMPIEALAKVCKVASPLLRCLILVALNTGATQWELSVLKRIEVDLKAGRVAKMRPKTNVYGCWRLWPETITALSKHMQQKGDTAFWTPEGKPLVDVTASGRIDWVDGEWSKATARAGVPHLGWKYLRKLGAQMIREIADLETSQLYLAHKGQSVCETHYTNPIPEKLDAALLKVRERLQTLFLETPEAAPDEHKRPHEAA